MENELTPEQLAMDEAYQEAKKQSLISSLTGAAGFRLGWEAAEAYAAKHSQKQHLVELMKMDEGKPKTNILALMQLAAHIQQMDKHMATQFQAHDYRQMWEIWRGVADKVNNIENTLKQKLNGTTNG